MTFQNTLFPVKLVKTVRNLVFLPLDILSKPIQEFCLVTFLNHVFKEQIEDGDLLFLEDKVIKIYISDISISWDITYKSGRFSFSDLKKGSEVKISADLESLILLASRREDPDTMFFQRRIVVEGDAELGLNVKNLMDSVDFDELPEVVNFWLQRGADLVEIRQASEEKLI